jgi:hypothetical protein
MFGFFRCFADEFDQSVYCVLTVSILRTEPPGINNQYTARRHPSSCKTRQTFAKVIRQRGAFGRVEAELHGCSGFVNMLSTRSRGADEFQLDFIRIN